MIKVSVVAVGRVKEKYFSDGIAEYAKRLARFCEFKIIEVKEENFAKVGASEREIIKRKEAERISPYLKGKVFVLAIEGEKLSSEGFSKLIRDAVDASGEVTFVIGGSYGLHDEIKKRADKSVSFSAMTFPHTLFRLMLTEQIYRAFSIDEGSAYHK